jgi:PPK2 family polyphosphate:nucleotide phosphotransferase
MAHDNGLEFDSGKYRVHSHKPFRLDNVDTRAKPVAEADRARMQTAKDTVTIDQWQDRLYAEGKRALLIVLQGMDTSGKDGTIKMVFYATGPLGVNVTSFRVPTADEMARDYLWRIHAAVPRRGMIGIFNRSHYEDVLVVKVKALAPIEAIERRYEEINLFEKMLAANGTTILKFMLHISKEEQKKRLEERVRLAEKRWKFNPDDLDDRRLWDKFMAAYEVMLNRCSTAWAPWYVIPADRNWARNFVIARVVCETLEAMAPQYPKPDWKPSEFSIQ